MFGISFLNPLLLIGLVTAAVPIALHLLGRRKLTPYAFSSLRLLRRVQEESRKRSRFSELLLLIIRTLIVLLLVLAVSRPVRDQFGLQAPGATGPGEHYLLLVDNSPSMMRRADGQSLTVMAQERVRRLLATMTEQDRVTLGMLFGDAPMLAFEAPPQELLNEPRALEFAPSSTPAQEYVAAVGEELMATYGIAGFETVLLSDLGEQALEPLRGTTFAREVPVQILPLTPDDAAEVAITVAEIVPESAVVNTPLKVRLRLEARNTSGDGGTCTLQHGEQTLATAPYTFTDGQAVVELEWSPRTLDAYDLACACGTDGYPLDNVVYFSVRAQGPREVLVIMPPGTETSFLELMLDPGSQVQGAPVTPFDVTRRSITTLPSMDLGAYDVVVLESIDESIIEHRDRLESWVATGGLLVWFPSPLLNAFDFANTFFPATGADGPLFPLRLETKREELGDTLQPLQLTTAGEYLPLTSTTSGVRLVRFGLEHVFGSVIADPVRSEVLLKGAGGDPLLVRKPFADGMVLQAAFPLDLGVNDFIRWPGALPLLHTQLLELTNARSAPPLVFRGDGVAESASAVALDPAYRQGVSGLSDDELQALGIGHGLVGSQRVGVNIPFAEGSERRLSPSGVAEVLPRAEVFQADEQSMAEVLAGSDVEPWRYLLWAVLGLLLLETLIANPVIGFLRELQDNVEQEAL